MISRIIGLLISIGLIIGGLSGEFVLRGTNSSTLLVIAGFVFLIIDIVSIVAYQKSENILKNMKEYDDIVSIAESCDLPHSENYKEIEQTTQTVNIQDKYTIKIPSFLPPTTTLNEDASTIL